MVVTWRGWDRAHACDYRPERRVTIAALPAGGLAADCRMTVSRYHHSDTAQKDQVISLIFVSVPLW